MSTLLCIGRQSSARARCASSLKNVEHSRLVLGISPEQPARRTFVARNQKIRTTSLPPRGIVRNYSGTTMSCAPADSFITLGNKSTTYLASSTSSPSLSRTQDQVAHNPSVPPLILLCTWMAASRRNINKYTEHYRTLYPDSSLLVLECSVANMFFTTAKAERRRLDPARDVLLATLEAYPGKPPVVLHVFSNGGATIAARLLASLSPEDRKRVARSLILDSAPGTSTWRRIWRAMMLTVPKGVVGMVLAPMKAGFMLGYSVITSKLLGRENVVMATRKRLNDARLFDKSVPRLYLYSKEDKLIDWEDVKSHADEARKLGYSRVEDVLFDDTPHCAHIMKHADAYWRAVTKSIDGKITGSQANL